MFELSDAISTIARWKTAGSKLVYTQGVFDLLHAGHTSYLERAASYGDKLIVGLDGDEIVRIRKGQGRPVQEFNTRASALSKIRHVGLIFEKPTPDDFYYLDRVGPHVFVTSEDTYLPDRRAELARRFAGQTVVLARTPDISTTVLVRRDNDG